MLAPKEKNLLIRLQKSETIQYKEFPDMLYNVRYEIAVSEMMDYNMNDIAMFIRQEFAKEDTERGRRSRSKRVLRSQDLSL